MSRPVCPTPRYPAASARLLLRAEKLSASDRTGTRDRGTKKKRKEKRTTRQTTTTTTATAQQSPAADMFGQSIRLFSSSAAVHKVGCAQVQPVHHKVRIVKKYLSPRFPELKLEPHDIRSPKFRPYLTHQDRVQEHYHDTLESDLLLINYKHGQQPVYGNKRRQWDMSSPYHLNRPLRKPKGQIVPSPTIEPRTQSNVPRLEGVTLNCFVKDAKLYPAQAISAALQLQQITGAKPQSIFAKTNVPNWKLRPGMKMGAKITLLGRDASQFVSTLTEIVLPRTREFYGISNRSGDRYGNIAFGLTADQVKLFPEIENNQDSWPQNFGFDVTLHTSAQTDADARILLSGLGFPFTGNERIPKTLLNDVQQPAQEAPAAPVAPVA